MVGYDVYYIYYPSIIILFPWGDMIGNCGACYRIASDIDITNTIIKAQAHSIICKH